MSENTQHDGDQAVKNRRPSLTANIVREYTDQNGQKKSHWQEIGVAWSNKDGGFTAEIHAVPLSGRIVFTKPKSNS
jgi:hypothetical protein